MRVLMLLLMPVMGFSQLDTSLIYHTKEVHTIVIKADSSTLSWKIDTTVFESPGEIKLLKRIPKICVDTTMDGGLYTSGELYIYYFATTISIDGYTGVYKVTKSEMHGTGRKFQYPYYELSNGSKLTWIENAVLWEFPVVNKKSKLIIFEID